jgi:hypothetical protein
MKKSVKIAALYKLLLKFLFLTIITVNPGFLKAQIAVTSSGGSASGTNGSLSYTIGQVFFLPVNATPGNPKVELSVGIQQPYEILVVSGIDEEPDIVGMFSVYPNPVTEKLMLVTVNNSGKNLYYHLYSTDGSHILTGKAASEILQIPVNTYPAGNYFLQLTLDNKVVKTFKIIKN